MDQSWSSSATSKKGEIIFERYSEDEVDGEELDYEQQFDQITGSFKRYATRFFAVRVAYDKDGRDVEKIVYCLRRAKAPTGDTKKDKKWKKVVNRDRMIGAMNGKNLIKDKFNLAMGCDYDGDDYDTANYKAICEKLKKKI